MNMMLLTARRWLLSLTLLLISPWIAQTLSSPRALTIRPHICRATTPSFLPRHSTYLCMHDQSEEGDASLAISPSQPNELQLSRLEEASMQVDSDANDDPYARIKLKRKYDPNLESCIVVAVDCTSHRASRGSYQPVKAELMDKVRDNEQMTIFESLKELQDLIRTAGLQILDICVQRMSSPLSATYIGSGKVDEIIALAEKLEVKTIVFDDDLTTKQQRSLEELFSASIYGQSMKILDRTAVILEIFAKRAKSREGQLQVELAMLEYRLTRGPKASGDVGRDNGAGFRGPGETKLETDKRVIKDKLVILRKEIDKLKFQRQQHRVNREQLGLPVVTLCGYTNAGKSTLMNRLSKAGVLAEDMLFATLDTTTRRVRIACTSEDGQEEGKSRQIMLTDTVGFISKLPASLVAAFRSTLEEVREADILVHVVDRSNPTWRKQRQTVSLDSMIVDQYWTHLAVML
jgi:GTPase